MDEIAAGIQMAVAKRCFVMAKKAGATDAITLTGGCANLGGNVYVYGTNAQNRPWSVAIQDPADSEGYVCTLSLSDAFVVTSGGYQRYFTAPDGTVYQHILDPKTGYPVQSDLTSVSVVTRGGFGGQGTRADAYSTALYVMGEQAAVDFWRSQSMSFDMVLITRDGRVVYTPGLADCFNEKDGTSYVYQLLAA
jgi:thiamine biosynthesis lipoprotein